MRPREVRVCIFTQKRVRVYSLRVDSSLEKSENKKNLRARSGSRSGSKTGSGSKIDRRDLGTCAAAKLRTRPRVCGVCGVGTRSDPENLLNIKWLQ